MHIFLRFSMAGIVVSMGIAQAKAATTNVYGNSSTPVFLGVLTGGVEYSITATGIVDEATGFNGGAGLTFTSNGTPTYAFPAPYQPFYPSGSDTDPSNGQHGAAGAGFLFGQLLLTLTATPTAPSDYIYLPADSTIITASDRTLYGVVNDDNYIDNSGFYSVSVGPVTAVGTVPLPASAPMFGAALIALGAASYGVRRKTAAAV